MKKLMLWGILCSTIPTVSIAQTADDLGTLDSIYSNILIKNSKTAVQSCHQLSDQMAQGKATDLPFAQPFSATLTAWKKVEATYFLGSLDVATLDYPTYIDMFHLGKEDVNGALDRALKSDNAPEKALFKNAYKTISSLEYLLYQPEKTERQFALAKVATKHICQYLEKIDDAYEHLHQDYLADPAKATALLLNAIIENMYKTKEWRVGDPAGLSRKYSGEADIRRSEYHLSQNSLPAIHAILEVHAQIIGEDAEPNLATISKRNGAEEAIKMAQTDLKKAIEASETIKSDADLTPEKSQTLFTSLSALQSDYYEHLVQSLGVVAKILDADGD